MEKLFARKIALTAAFMLWIWSCAAQAHDFRYRYISINKARLPAGVSEFFPYALTDSGRVYGNAFNDSGEIFVAVYANGTVTVLQPGSVSTANNRGTAGGSVLDPLTGYSKAALFQGTKVKIIPYLGVPTNEYVVSVNDSNAALVSSNDPLNQGRTTYRLYKNGRTTFQFQIPNGSDCPCWEVNNAGIVVGTIYDESQQGFRAIRFRPPYYEAEVLDPVRGDVDATSSAINGSGHVLGLSNSIFVNPSSNHYGIWDRQGRFRTYFQGEVFYESRFNDAQLIVLTGNLDTDLNSYIIPRPGIRLNVKNLITNQSSTEAPLSYVADINNHGDMIGQGYCVEPPCSNFLLRREREE